MAKRFTIEAVFKMIDKVTAPITRIQNRLQKFTRTVRRNFTRLNRTVGKLGAGIKRMSIASVAALGTLAFAMGNVIGVGAEFGRAIGSAAAKFPEGIKRGSKEFKELEKVARRVGSETEFTATQAAQGLNFLAKAGFNARDAIGALPDIVNFATASEIGLAEAADIASDAIGAFGLDSDDPVKKLEGLNRIMDVMSKTANSTNTSVAELFESMKKGGPVSDTAGASVETFSAIMGFLASNGIKAAQAGTASKNVTLALAGVGNKAAKTFESLGIKLEDSTGNMRDQLDVLDDLRKSLSTRGEKEQIELIAAIFGKIPIAAAAKLVGNTGVKIRELRIELEKAGGSSKRTAAFIRNDVKGSLDALNSSIEGVKISIFSLNEGPLKNAIDQMTDWIRTNEKVIATGIGEFFLMIINNMSEIVTWIKNIAIGLAAFFAFAAVLKIITVAMTAFNLIMMINPVGLVVIGILALIAAFTSLVVWIDDINSGFESLPGVVRLALLPIELLVKAIKFLKDNSEIIIGVTRQAIENIEEYAKPVTDVFNAAADFISPVTSVVGDIDRVLTNTINKGFESVGLRDADEELKDVVAPQIISPQERIAKSVQENNNTTTSHIVVSAESGSNARVVKNGMGAGLKLATSGAM